MGNLAGIGNVGQPTFGLNLGRRGLGRRGEWPSSLVPPKLLNLDCCAECRECRQRKCIKKAGVCNPFPFCKTSTTQEAAHDGTALCLKWLYNY